MIDKLSFNNLTTMEDCSVDLSAKMNVFIGANGTGKTHLLKAAYGLAFAKSRFLDASNMSKDATRKLISQKLVSIFRPMNDKLGRLHRAGTSGTTQLRADFADGDSLQLSFSGRSTYVDLTHEIKNPELIGDPVFIPTKEVLTFMDGITDSHADQHTVDRLFDATYQDICKLLAVPVDSEASSRINEDPRFGAIFPSIGNAIGGMFLFDKGRVRFVHGSYGDRRVTNQYKLGVLRETVFTQEKKDELSGHMTAEGFRKIGILQQLLANRSLEPGVSGTLFWDEPESNMNPRLMRLLVEILLVISRASQQVVLATHDYVLLKWIDLLSDGAQGDHVRYHSLYRDPDTDSVRVNSTDEYTQLSPNAIDDAFGDLTDEEIASSMGKLGK